MFENFIITILDYFQVTLESVDIFNGVFLFLAVLSVFSALMVVLALNPVHSILFLILTFFNMSLIMILIGAEFIGLLYLIVYIGAVAVLFLFVVMMLDIRRIRTKFAKKDLLLILGFICFFIFELFLMFGSAFSLVDTFSGPSGTMHSVYLNLLYLVETRVHGGLYIIGMLLYTQKYLHFLLTGFILLIAMLGAIILTLNKSSFKKQQADFKQLNRDHTTAVVLKNLIIKQSEDDAVSNVPLDANTVVKSVDVSENK